MESGNHMTKLEHYYKTVPGWCAFAELYVDMVAMAPADRPSLFVEVGSWQGKSAALMGVEILNSGKPIILHCIDPWQDGGPDLVGTPYESKRLAVPLYEAFVANTQPVASVLVPHRDMSLSKDLLAAIANQSVDFLMLDGDHSYETVKAEIAAYLPKMKQGGIISGDDYLWPGVKQAVDEAFGDLATKVIKKDTPNYRNSVAYWWVQL